MKIKTRKLMKSLKVYHKYSGSNRSSTANNLRAGRAQMGAATHRKSLTSLK